MCVDYTDLNKACPKDSYPLPTIDRLVGRLTSLSRFVPKLAERTRPIIKLLKKTTKFEWTDECEQNFQQLKTFLASPPVIPKPNAREPIVVYLVVSNEAVSSVLVQEIEAEERPVYFVSRVLHDAETRYQMVEKVALALVITARRMRMYFQNHKVIVRTNYPIMKILTKPDLAGRMIGWAVELSEFHIEYQPRGAIKSQALADFTAELTPYPTEQIPRWTLRRWIIKQAFVRSRSMVTSFKEKTKHLSSLILHVLETPVLVSVTFTVNGKKDIKFTTK